MPVVLLNAPRACFLMGVFNLDDGVIEITCMYFTGGKPRNYHKIVLT